MIKNVLLFTLHKYIIKIVRSFIIHRKILVVFALFSLIITIYFISNDHINEVDKHIPLITPETGETKIKPLDPGGTEFPNMDKSVYEYISPSNKLTHKEKVMPEPEHPALFLKEQNLKSAGEVKTIFEAPEDESNISEVPTLSYNENIADSKINILTMDQADSRLGDFCDDEAPKSNLQKYKLQLASCETEQAAITHWNKMLKDNKDLLKSYHYNLKKDVNNQNIIYKLQIGPFNSYDKANSICRRLIKRKYECSVINY